MYIYNFSNKINGSVLLLTESDILINGLNFTTFVFELIRIHIMKYVIATTKYSRKSNIFFDILVE